MGVLVIVGTEKGAFLCRAGQDRQRWEFEGPLFKGWKATASGRSPSGRYLLATTSQVYGAALHASTDVRTWRQIDKGPAYPEGGERKLNQIWTIRCGPDRHYAGVDEAGLFVSDDDGESWRPMSGLNDHPSRRNWFPGAGGLCAHAVLTHPQRPDQIWCGISAVGMFRSDDGGHTWQPKNEGVKCLSPDKDYPGIGYCVHGLVQDPGDPDTIFRQDHSGMYRTRDGGDSWERNEEGLPSWFGFPITIDERTRTLYSFPMESDEYRLPVNGKFRVYRSRTRGDSWEPVGKGLPDAYYGSVLRGALTVDNLDPVGVYVGTTAGDVFVSADGGDSWQALDCRLPRVLSVAAYAEA
jgi:BNR/Asp-box repeat